jgi:hypothetical protein
LFPFDDRGNFGGGSVWVGWGVLISTVLLLDCFFRDTFVEKNMKNLVFIRFVDHTVG